MTVDFRMPAQMALKLPMERSITQASRAGTPPACRLENRMKIGQAGESPVGSSAPGEPKVTSAKAGTQATGAASNSSTKVKLSDAVSGLLAGKELTSDVFDAAKVEHLANAIAQGKFVVNPAVVADKLIANARELLDKKTH
jgi:negative regulator of flagellin synthesis FlgM